jgi:predicted protein tyrosine phosphatase
MLWITSHRQWLDHAERIRPAMVVSLMDPGSSFHTPNWLVPDRHLCLEFHDVEEEIEGYRAPTRDHVERLLGFAQSWSPASTLLVHCHAGVSRSSATALLMASQRLPGQELAIARCMREAGPWFKPNMFLIATADDLLQLGGRLVAAARSMREPTVAENAGPVAVRLQPMPLATVVDF